MSVDKNIGYILSDEKRYGTYRGCLINKLITLDNMPGWVTCNECEQTGLPYDNFDDCVGYGCVRTDFTVMVNDIKRFTTIFKNILK